MEPDRRAVRVAFALMRSPRLNSTQRPETRASRWTRRLPLDIFPAAVPAAPMIKLPLVLVASLCVASSFSPLHAADDDITWLVQYDGREMPDAKWTVIGKP